jgi:hypothetical protein
VAIGCELRRRSWTTSSDRSRPRAGAGVGGVGDALQLLEHEHGNHELAVDEAGRDQVADTAVDDGRGVDEHGQRLRLARRPLALQAQPRPAALARLIGSQAAETQDRAVAASADDGEQVPSTSASGNSR